MTDNKRNLYDYRKKYLEHNHGIFGYYLCYLCLKPVTKEEMEVDHIFPLSKGGPNHIINCVSSCRNCNRKKSDKIDYRTFRGIIFKIIEELFLCLISLFKHIFKFVTSLININNRIILCILAVVIIVIILF